jgi:hypothetical protein
MCSRAFRPLGLPIYVARRPAAPFTRRYPRDFTFYVADPISAIHHFEHRIKELSEKYRSLAEFIE